MITAIILTFMKLLDWACYVVVGTPYFEHEKYKKEDTDMITAVNEENRVIIKTSTGREFEIREELVPDGSILISPVESCESLFINPIASNLISLKCKGDK